MNQITDKVSRGARSPASKQVDWEEIERVLADIDEQFSHPNFDPLKHALSTLGSITAEKDLADLRQQWNTVDKLVDQVVDAHYSGFNKSLQNYSQILKLFTESRLHLSALRRSLETAHVRLQPQPDQLLHLYRRYLMLGDMLRLLDDVSVAVGVPEKVRQLGHDKEWSLAVSTFLEGCNKAAREELSGVGALQQLREDLVLLRKHLLSLLTQELEHSIYYTSNSTSNDNTIYNNSNTTSTDWMVKKKALSISIGSDTELHHHRTTSAIPDHQQQRQHPYHRRTATIDPGTLSSSHHDGHLMNSDVSINVLVNCTAHLGGVNHVLASLRSSMQQRMQNTLCQTLRNIHMNNNRKNPLYSMQQQYFPTTNTMTSSSSSSSVSNTTNDDIMNDVGMFDTATVIAEVVCSTSMTMLQSIAKLLQSLCLAKPPAMSAGLHMAMDNDAIHNSDGTNNQEKKAHERAFEEVLYAWETLQVECQAILAALLGTAQPDRQRLRATRHQNTFLGEGWLASIDIVAPNSDDVDDTSSMATATKGNTSATTTTTTTSMLLFSIMDEMHEQNDDHTLLSSMKQSSSTTSNISKNGTNGTNANDNTSNSNSNDYVSLVSMILGSSSRSSVLIAAVYQHFITLNAAAENLLESILSSPSSSQSLNKQSSNDSTPRTPLHMLAPWLTTTTTMTNTNSSILNSALQRMQNSLLRSYIDSFIRMDFLPSVYLSSRTRVKALTENSDAFTPRAKLQGGFSTSTAVLPAARSTVSMTEELLRWSIAIPPFAPDLSGVIENILGQILDAFKSTVASLASNTMAYDLANTINIVQLMAQEAVAPLLGSPLHFFIGKTSDAMDSFLSQAIAAGFGSQRSSSSSSRSSATIATNHLVTTVMKACRPVSADRLLSLQRSRGCSSIVMLASLATSAEYIADAMQSAGAALRFASTESNQSDRRRLLQQQQEQQGGRRSFSSPRKADAWLKHISGFTLWNSSNSIINGGSNNNNSSSSVTDNSNNTNNSFQRDFADSLSHSADRFRALAGECMRMLRLEIIILTLHHIEALPRMSNTNKAQATKEEAHITALARHIARLDEELLPYVSQEHRSYVFGCLPNVVVQMAIDVLPEFTSIDVQCAVRVCRVLSQLQPVVCAASGGASVDGSSHDGDGQDGTTTTHVSEAASKRLEKAKLYYSMLTHSVDSCLNAIAQKPTRFTATEYAALLNVNVPGRHVTAEHKARLQEILSSASTVQRA